MLIDYSTARPPIPVLKAAGVTAVGRYLGQDCETGFSCIHKNLTKPEAHDLLAAGIDIWLAFEYDPQQALDGATQGAKDGLLATRQLHDLGAPPDMAVYFALDFDLRDYAPHLPDDGTVGHARAKLGPVADYFDAIHGQHPKYAVGGYGGYYAIRRLFDAKLISFGWQTLAWSGGQWDSRAVLRQLARQVFGAADVDLHASSLPDFGQWPRPHDGQPPFPAGRHQADGTGTLAMLARRQHCHVSDILWATVIGVDENSHETHPSFGDLERVYFNAGKWDAKMPKGMIVWLP